MEYLDELILLQLRLKVLVLREVHVDGHVDHLDIGVAKAGICGLVSYFSNDHIENGEEWGSRYTIEHDRRALRDLAHIPRLLLELAHSRLLGCLTLIDQPGGDLNGDFVYGWTVLLLEDNLRSCRPSMSPKFSTT